MGMASTRYKRILPWLAVIVATGPQIAFSAPPNAAPMEPFNLTARYNVAWTGITIGRIYVIAQEDKDHYHLTVDTKTHGIATIFSQERRIAEAEGTINHGRYISTRYESRPQGQDEGRRVTITYNAEGHIATREQVPQDNPAWRPVVSLELANQATNPITAGLILRRALYEDRARGKNEAEVKTYDGERLATMHFNVVNLTTRVQVMGAYQPAINTRASRTPIAGYTSKEIKKYNSGDPEIHLYFSDDAKFIPIRATADTTFGQLSATMVPLNDD